MGRGEEGGEELTRGVIAFRYVCGMLTNPVARYTLRSVEKWPMRITPKKLIVLRPKKMASEVKGPIRCLKCQLLCRDAAAYLSHKCEQRSSPNW